MNNEDKKLLVIAIGLLILLAFTASIASAFRTGSGLGVSIQQMIVYTTRYGTETKTIVTTVTTGALTRTSTFIQVSILYSTYTSTIIVSTTSSTSTSTVYTTTLSTTYTTTALTTSTMTTTVTSPSQTQTSTTRTSSSTQQIQQATSSTTSYERTHEGGGLRGRQLIIFPLQIGSTQYTLEISNYWLFLLIFAFALLIYGTQIKQRKTFKARKRR